MATSRNHFASHDDNPERRRNPRVAPTLLTYVSFGGSNGGMVLDVSADGLALATALPVPDKQLLNIAIPSDQAHQLIEVTGRVVWISESKRRVGLQLVEPSPSSQEFLRKWVATVLQRQTSVAPSVARLDAENWNPAAIVEACAPLPMQPVASEGIAEPKTQLTLGLLRPPEPMVTERPQPRGALLVMVANSATNIMQAPATQTSTTETSPTETPTTEPLITQIPAVQISITQLSETQILEVEMPATEVPATDSEEIVSGKDTEEEVIPSEAAKAELVAPVPIPVAAAALPILNSQPAIETFELPAIAAEPSADPSQLPGEQKILSSPATPAPIPVAAAALPILNSQPAIETFELPAIAAEPSADPSQLPGEQKILSSPATPAPIPVAAAALPILNSQPAIETFELPAIAAEPSADPSQLPGEQKILSSPATTTPIVERETVTSPPIREVRDLLLSLEAAESNGTPAAMPPRLASKQPAKTGPSSASPMSSSLLLVSVLVVVVSFAVGILIGRSLLAERLGHPATKIDAAAPAILSRGNAQSHTGGPVTTTTGVTGMPTGTSTAPLRIAGGGTRAVSSSGAATEQDKSAARTAVTAAGIEMVVTPNEGDTPLRVDLPEEAVVQSASLEVRGQRFLYVPGAAPQRNHKVRKERVVIGPLLSRVTPPPPEVPAGAQGGEQVVTVRATIDGDGHVSYVDPLNGPITLIPAVMTAVREWRFAPSSLNGEPLKTTVDLTLRFRPTP
jgi:hypothetical protein